MHSSRSFLEQIFQDLTQVPARIFNKASKHFDDGTDTYWLIPGDRDGNLMARIRQSSVSVVWDPHLGENGAVRIFFEYDTPMAGSLSRSYSNVQWSNNWRQVESLVYWTTTELSYSHYADFADSIINDILDNGFSW
ncbi:MAG: hypothetical protein ACTSUE_00290 [Promethearchaeota archaeon]